MVSCVCMSSMAYWHLVLFAWSGIQTGFFRSAHFLCRDMAVVLWRQQSTYLIQDAICNIMLLLILCKVCTLWSHLVSTCFQSEFWLVSFGVCNCRFVHILQSAQSQNWATSLAQLGQKVHWMPGDGRFKVLAFNQLCSIGQTWCWTLMMGITEFWLSISTAQWVRPWCWTLMMSVSKVLAFSFFVGPHVIFSSIVCMHVDQFLMECVTSGNEFVCEKFKYSWL